MSLMKAFDSLISKSNAILIIASRPLDFDSLGSGLILKKYLESLGKKVKLVYPETLTGYSREVYGFLPFFKEIIFGDSREILKHPDGLLILLDGTSLVQFYDAFQDPSNPPDFKIWPERLRIDHHLQKPEKLETRLIRDPQASSTTEIILHRIIPPGFINQQIATIGYAALAGDTGNFCWNFTASTLKLASVLVAKDADKLTIINRLFYFKSANYFKLVKLVIDNVEFDPKLKTVFLTIPYRKLKTWNLSEEDYREMRLTFLEELGRKVRGFDRYVALLEKDPGHIHVSARGNNLNNKINLPKMFMEVGGNGGGHFNALGFEVEGNLGEVKARVKKLIGEYLLPKPQSLR